MGGATGAIAVIALVPVVLNRTDDGGTVDAAADLPAVPLVGVDQPGLELVDTAVRPLGDGTSPTLTYTSFSTADDPAGPIVTVIVEPDSDETPLGDDPVDLDGDGDATGDGDGFLTTVGANGGAVGLLWPLPDGRVAGFGGFEVSEEFFVDYVRDLDDVGFDPATIASPDGLDERQTSTLPSASTTQAVTSYAGDDGTLQVTTTNDPAWFDLMRMSMSVDIVGDLTETDLGESFLGPGYAVSTDEAGNGSAFALVRTESGLTLEISTDGIAADVVDQILADGRLTEVSPIEEPAATTSVATASTLPPASTSTVTTTSIVGPSGGSRSTSPWSRASSSTGSRSSSPRLCPATRSHPPPSPSAGTAVRRRPTVRRTSPSGSTCATPSVTTFWEGVDLTSPDPDGAIRSIWSCGWYEGAVHVAIALDAPGNPRSTGPPASPSSSSTSPAPDPSEEIGSGILGPYFLQCGGGDSAAPVASSP